MTVIEFAIIYFLGYFSNVWLLSFGRTAVRDKWAILALSIVWPVIWAMALGLIISDVLFDID